MLDICLLGTGGMMPLPKRWLTSMMARYNGSSYLIDCGEGTQIAIAEHGWSFKPIDVICFTHYHADHISGLPGILLAMANSERAKPLRLIGPKGLERIVRGLTVIAPDLPFELEVTEITEQTQTFGFNDLEITAFRVNHRLICYGYSISIKRKGRFDVERAKGQDIPLKFWNRLQKGETIRDEEIIYTPDMVLGPERKGLKVTYTTDTRPGPAIIENARGSDLLICEGMYGEAEKKANALAYKHMMMTEAAEIAAAAQVPELWLTHYSPSMVRPDHFMKECKEIFPGTIAGKDGMSKEFRFDDEE